MKKSLALVAMLAIALAACGKKEEAKPVEAAPAAPAAAPAAPAAAPAADAKK
jgi:predicted small lipoprotein YifL